MSPRQDGFIRSLMNERVIADDLLVRLNSTLRGDVPTAQASKIIEWLLKQPKKQQTSPAPRFADVPEGRYAIDGADGSTAFYRVDRPTEGKWAGFTFVSAQASDDFWPVKNREAKAAILAAIARDPHASSVRYGRELGVCGVCGRTLTDEASRAAGIGPVCAARFGIDRVASVERPVHHTPVHEEPAEEPAPVRTAKPARKSDGRDKQGVAYGYGDWKARRRQLHETLAEDGRGPKGKAPEKCSQLTTLPGTTFEDIFSLPAA